MSKEREPVIVGAARTAIGKFGGTLSQVSAVELGGIVIRAAVERAGIVPADVDEVIMGNVIQAGLGQNPARQAALRGGLPDEVGALTINKVCGSGLKAVMLAAQAIRAGDGSCYVAGGMENMNQGPYLLRKARFGYRLGNDELIDSTVNDGLWCAIENQHMGVSAEWIACEYNVSREDQDALAVESQVRAAAAIEGGQFRDEIVPVTVPQRKGPPIQFDTDEAVRPNTNMEALARLRPAFREEGTVTAGNAPGITDGAASVVVTSRAKADALRLTPLARITGYAQAAVKPLALFAAPIYAVQRLMGKLGVGIEYFDLIEINEAFAAQTLANGRELGVDWARVNVNGGAIALGHPIGASGARVLVTLLYAMQNRGAQTGLATLCLGGGEAVALSVEREA
jgi:acetyl-CoA C-acetyltransferase